MKKPLTSVIIPTYNYAHCLTRAINSAAQQAGGGNYEILVVNDGSTDNTTEAIKPLLKKHKKNYATLKKKMV
ncbi:MAG: hypothetical protein A6F71_07570 [Cycloclasticus sp. symbiont of Poecilosclerida sp. M]|nr:MAG: hypothetical protein A6F71_07570 [Cycloclasticus sp. symbiont of Poecilosclerida sp. M]